MPGRPDIAHDPQIPQARLAVSPQAGHPMVELQRGALLDERVGQDVRERSEVDIRARRDARRRDRLVLAATRDEQRRPRSDDGRILRVLQAGEERVILERLETLLEVGDVVGSPHETHVRNGVEEARGLRQHPFADQVRPELP
jgi:hypothetical protein